MRHIAVPLFALFAIQAFAQAPAGEGVYRVFNLSRTESAQDLQEITTVVRATTEIRQVTSDAALRTISVRGSADQVALAEWLCTQLDKPDVAAGPLEFVMPATDPGTNNNVVRIFYLTNTTSAQDLHEVATLMRAIGDFRQLFSYRAPKAIVVRGSKAQMDLAVWLVNEIDSASRSAGGKEYQAGGSSDDLVRVFYLTNVSTPQRLQEIATQIRVMTEVRRLFVYRTPKAIAVRGTPAQIALAARMIEERDR